MKTNLEQFKSLGDELDKYLVTFFDDMEDGEYDEVKHDIQLVVGGKEFTFNMHANLYENLAGFIKQGIKDELMDEEETK